MLEIGLQVFATACAGVYVPAPWFEKKSGVVVSCPLVWSP